MNSKRSTPQSKGPFRGPLNSARSRTPNNLNSTYLERRESTLCFSRPSSATKVRSSSHLDLTSIGNSSAHPNFRTNLLNLIPYVDSEVDCDLVYGDYLQSLMKRTIILKAIDKHETEINDQLVIQQDSLYKNKLTCQKIKKDIEELNKLEEVQELVKIINQNCIQFQQLSENFDLKEHLQQLVDLLKWLCTKLNLENIKKLEEADFHKLHNLLQNCLQGLNEICSVEENMEEVNQLASVMKTYQENLASIQQSQKTISNLQKGEMYKFLKSTSDMYAAREKYSYNS